LRSIVIDLRMIPATSLALGYFFNVLPIKLTRQANDPWSVKKNKVIVQPQT
jgi:hypothetical protein